jgi:hypothetical protein
MVGQTVKRGLVFPSTEVAWAIAEPSDIHTTSEKWQRGD